MVLGVFFLFIGCQKELSTEGEDVASVATGSLLDAAGNCQNITVNGSYNADSALSSNNYVILQLSVKSAGNYKVFTDLQNGFSFQDSGYISAGAHSVKLKATGRPIAATQTNFQVIFDTTSCSFSITVNKHAAPGRAYPTGSSATANRKNPPVTPFTNVTTAEPVFGKL